MNKVALLGAGGHTRSVINLLEHMQIRINGIFDDNYHESSKENICGYSLEGKISDCPPDLEVVLSIGDNQRRAELFHRYSGQILRTNLLHPRAYIEQRTEMGVSNQIFANVYINTGVRIGDNNIINTAAVLEHEVQIGFGNHISVSAVLCGRARIGSYCFVGAGAVVIDKVEVVDHVTIGANGVVIRDILEAGVYVGNPVRRVK